MARNCIFGMVVLAVGLVCAQAVDERGKKNLTGEVNINGNLKFKGTKSTDALIQLNRADATVANPTFLLDEVSGAVAGYFLKFNKTARHSVRISKSYPALGNLSANKKLISNVSDTTHCQKGMLVYGTGIPIGATITSFTSNSITISTNVTSASGNAEIRLGYSSQDFGFHGVHTDVSEIQNFVGPMSGYVNTIYDTTGNANDLVATSVMNEPAIVKQGVLQADGSSFGILGEIENVNYGSVFRVLSTKHSLALTNSFSVVAMMTPFTAGGSSMGRIFEQGNNFIFAMQNGDSVNGISTFKVVDDHGKVLIKAPDYAVTCPESAVFGVTFDKDRPANQLKLFKNTGIP